VSTLLDPLDEQQTALVQLVWSQFAGTARFPKYQWVAHMMRLQGYNAAEAIGSLPSVGIPEVRGRYSAIWTTDLGGFYQPGNEVCLTMAGLYHLKEPGAMQVIGGVLEYARALSTAQDRIADHPFDLPEVHVSLTEAVHGGNELFAPAVGAVAEHEWPAMQVTKTADDWSGRLALLASAEFTTIEQYLVAVIAACPAPQPPALGYQDPKALSHAITNFDITCELVLKSPMVKLPPVNRTVWFGLDAGSLSDLQAALSAAGELLAGLQVPGKSPSHPTGRLLSHLTAELPNIDAASVKDAIEVLDAVRDVRNSGVHSKPAPKLIAAHDLLGLPFPLVDPAWSWNVIRANLTQAFTTLQLEILAAR
jgi:hypothetical protein